MHPNGTVKQLRIFNKNLTARVDIEYSMHQGKMILHAHDYTNSVRGEERELSPAEYRKYKKFFGGRK